MAGFGLKSEYIPQLGILWPGTRTPLTPLLPPGNPQEQDQIRTVLGPAGLLDSTGTIGSPCHTAMKVLAAPSRLITADFMRPDYFHMVTRYFSKDVENTFTHIVDESGYGQGFTILTLQDLIAVCDLEDPVSNMAAVPVDLALEETEAQLLAALLDSERISARNAIAGSADPGNLSIFPAVQTPSSAAACFSTATEQPGDYVFLGLLNSGHDIGKTSSTVPGEKDFLALINNGLIRQSGNGYELSESLLFMARRTVFIDMAVTISIRYIDTTGSIHAESAQCIRADGTLLWFIRPPQAPGTILLKYVPSSRFGEILQSLFGDESYSLSGMIVPAAETKPKTRFCPQCGAEHRAEAIFCNQCGYRFT